MAGCPRASAARRREQLRELMAPSVFKPLPPCSRARTLGVLSRAARSTRRRRKGCRCSAPSCAPSGLADRRASPMSTSAAASIDAMKLAPATPRCKHPCSPATPVPRSGAVLAAGRRQRGHFGRAPVPGERRNPCPSRGRQVCSCFDVGEAQIARRRSIHARHGRRETRNCKPELRCGTNCGSCLPELTVVSCGSEERAA